MCSTFTLYGDVFWHLWGLLKGSIIDVPVNIYISVKLESALRCCGTFSQASATLRYMPYKGCVSVGHN